MICPAICPAGHRSGAGDWCDVCGREIALASCAVCSAPRAGRFCDECGADDAVPRYDAVVSVDPEWFARWGVADREPPDTPPLRVRLDHRRTVVGRSRPGRPAPDVDLDDDGVSTRHAALARTGDGWTVVDLGSHNGTALGRTRLTPYRAVPLPPGEVVRLGLWTAIRIQPGRV